MKNIIKKLKSKRGETLVSILASMNIDLAARRRDEQFYNAVSSLEKMETSEDMKTLPNEELQYYSVKVEEDKLIKSGEHSNVDVEYLTQDGLTVYRGE